QKRKDEICPFSSLAFFQPTTVDKESKKLQTRYNKGVQANCKAKGEKYGTKGSFVLFLFQLTIFLYFFFLSL
ncbi:hypothetical protein OLA82_08485, partial [Streptococcus pneumoniae]|nr:hypothetical protein [Streptococcus pneumoniae]MDG8559387.1 hypothetical protein [Streptococcus pneumoniae]